MPYHLIFEGAELSGKSWVMSQIYQELEPKFATDPNVLDGCYWLNCDLGFFGTELAAAMLKNYLAIFETLSQKNIIVEKFLLSALVYGELYGQGQADRAEIENRLQKMGFKIVLLTFPENKGLVERRLEDRLRLYPNYGRIAKAPEFYIAQQRLYQKYLLESKLDNLIIEADKFPDTTIITKIREWLN